MLYAKIALLLLVVAYVIAFVVQNTDQIKIDFVFASARVHLIWKMLLLLARAHRRRAALAATPPPATSEAREGQSQVARLLS